MVSLETARETGRQGGLASAAVRRARIAAARERDEPSPYHRAYQTTCKRGHRLTPENSWIRHRSNRKTQIVCRRCERDRKARWRGNSARVYLPEIRGSLGEGWNDL